uniref:Uncharacterized protein n=1 Tax=Kwoniella pini CBS 10737 TaxID=1296096 RepID=A0A1B9I7G0_9TREE|nr:uncharacterized protein I206_02206 [Kwoniella pini CBS 10737]OCF51492.1 hypothetical protein I206_02206 [Kwoniella pini CBS 10737]
MADSAIGIDASYAKYPFNHPTPYPPPRTGENEPQQLNAEDTPYSMKIKDGTIIFARTLIILPRPIIEHHSSSSYYQRHAFVQVYTDGSDDSSGTSRSRWDDKPSVLTHLDQRRLLADGD